VAWHGEKQRHSVAAHKAWKTKRAKTTVKSKKVKSAK
jgi:hypothetical protein